MKKILIITICFSIIISCAFAKTYDDEDYVVIDGEKVLWDGVNIIEPESNLDIFNMKFSDFGDFFKEEYPVTVSSYKIAGNSAAETTVYHIHSENPGPTVYIAGGIHGNERAGWYAGVLMKDATVKCGDLYVLSQANIIGARNVTRYVNSRSLDPNRYFPGKKNGNLTEYLDWSIFTDVEEKNPDIVLDLHEAILYTDTADFLGSSYIYTIEGDYTLMIYGMVWATEDGELCHNEFSTVGPGTKGSLNEVISHKLNIPVITVETFRGFDIYRRVYDQLDSINYCLEYLGMR